MDNCGLDEQRCNTSGNYLFWSSSCISFSVQQDASEKRAISFTVADEIITDAFSKWTNADCGMGRTVGLSAANYGPVECGIPVYNSKGPNANVWMFADDEWRHTGDAHTLALTTVRYDPESGEIFDADVEINSAQSMITFSDKDVRADLESIVTHEAGHFLGLSHSNDPEATMWAGYSPRNTSMRDLSKDDIDGICAAYPPDRIASSANCDPRRGFTALCTEEVSRGCSVVGSALSSQPRVDASYTSDSGTNTNGQGTSRAWAMLGTAGIALFWARRARFGRQLVGKP